MRIIKRNLKTLSLSLLSFLLLGGCTEETIKEITTELSDPALIDEIENIGEVTLAGRAIKGVIQNAVVSVYRIQNGEVVDHALTSTVTDDLGNFSFRLPRKQARRLLYLEVTTSNSTIDPTLMTCDAVSGCGNRDGQSIQFGDTFKLNSNFVLRNVIKLKGHEERMPAHFSPLRHMVVAQAEALPGGLSWENINVARSNVTETFALSTSIEELSPFDLTSSDEQSFLATDDELIAAIIDASFLNIVENQRYLSVETVLAQLTHQNGHLNSVSENGFISRDQVFDAASDNIPDDLYERTNIKARIIAATSGTNPLPPTSTMNTLTVQIQGEGSVINADNAINCTANNCTYSIDESKTLALMATPDRGFQFVRWETNCISAAAGECRLSMNSNKTLTAIFSEATILTGEATVAWSTPSQREDGTSLPLSEISQYTIYYGKSRTAFEGAATVSIKPDRYGKLPTQTTIKDLSLDTNYYFAGVTVDNNGVSSKLSNIVLKAVQ
ncbi:MAG: hypothetical protein KUG80_03225 [Gammaproteobacteria bacterium]|nr:hypothetical protein [Gammaproteobacteria bacterium]